MLTLFVKYLFILISFFTAFYKISNIKMRTHSLCSTIFIIPLISLFIALLSKQCVSLRIFLMFTLSYILITLITKYNYYISFITTAISFGLSFVFYILSTIFIISILLIIYKRSNAIPYFLADFLVGIMQTLCLYYIFKIQRFCSGIRSIIIQSKPIIGVLFSLLFILYTTSFTTYKSHNEISIRAFLSLGIFCFSLFLLYYWNYRITQTYKEKLRLANQKSLEDELDNKLSEIEALKADNERLAKLIHKDNKLIPAMHMAVTDFLENIDKLPTEELLIHGHELSTQLYKMAADREGILNEAQSKTNTLPLIGIHTVDGVLSYMETRATKENITYKLHIDENIKELIINSISEADLCHLLSDLIENAIIATRYSNNNKQIKIHLGELKNSFLLEISDSGKEFDIETYQHFGYEKHTTHAEHGGSGIGLVDIWKIKKQNKISLQIYEYLPDSSAYTKKISFVFDRKNHFLMQTYRYKEIISTLTRGDLYVFPYESKENL